MIFRASSPFITRLGIILCGVCSATVRAALVMPGVLAICLKLGASGLVEVLVPLSMAWHSAHTSRANRRPSSHFRFAARSHLRVL